MARAGLKYDTVEGRNALHRLAELHSYSLHKASVQLAKERGKCEWFDKTKYSDDTPWLPIDTYAKEVDKYHTQELLCDWESLRADIKKYGVRFSVHEAYMPVESSSLFTASTNSLYPIRDKKMFKKSPKGTVYFEAPGIEEFGENYQSAYDISTKDMIIVYAIFQKFAGQGISADFYQKLTDGNKVSMREQYENMFFSAKLGLKTWYYLNSLTNSVDPEKAVEKDATLESCDSCTL
jgi:ribonucleoside-diphosphate reductase alpha chain